MSTQYVEYPVTPVNRGFSWSGIFAGAFLFLAIESTFGVLGAAIFGLPLVGTRNSVGIGIWMVILSIIALYFAGKLASKVSGATTRNMGMYDGLVTFGMSVLACFMIVAMFLRSSAGGSAISIRLSDSTIAGGYWLFVALILAMISAASGGIHGAWMSEKRQPPVEKAVEPRKVA
jgi:hypothetical protein